MLAVGWTDSFPFLLKISRLYSQSCLRGSVSRKPSFFTKTGRTLPSLQTFMADLSELASFPSVRMCQTIRRVLKTLSWSVCNLRRYRGKRERGGSENCPPVRRGLARAPRAADFPPPLPDFLDSSKKTTDIDTKLQYHIQHQLTYSIKISEKKIGQEISGKMVL